MEKNITPEEQAFSDHADSCVNLCGVNYTPGRCVEGDRLGDAMDAAKAGTKSETK